MSETKEGFNAKAHELVLQIAQGVVFQAIYMTAQNLPTGSAVCEETETEGT